MVGIVLGLGFQWWPALTQPWQYIAFIFVYMDIIDYWIDYSPSLKRFPPKRELDVMLDVAIMFTLFLYIYTTQLSIIYFLTAFIIFKIFDLFWLVRARIEYHPSASKDMFLQTWITINTIESALTAGLIVATTHFTFNPITTLIIFIATRLLLRICASLQYKKIHLV
jgi:hypothetical protein